MRDRPLHDLPTWGRNRLHSIPYVISNCIFSVAQQSANGRIGGTTTCTRLVYCAVWMTALWRAFSGPNVSNFGRLPPDVEVLDTGDGSRPSADDQNRLLRRILHTPTICHRSPFDGPALLRAAIPQNPATTSAGIRP